MLEGFARWKFGVPDREKLPLVRVKPDQDIGWVMLPGNIHYTYDKEVRLNNYGFRGVDIPDNKPGNEYRIIVLGDSHIYGQGLTDENLLTTVLQDRLNKLGHECSYRVVNTGVRGYSINNELAVLKKAALSLNPDHVILFFYINDFHEADIEERYVNFKDKDWYMYDLSDKPTNQIIRKWKLVQILRKSSFLMHINDTYVKIINNNNFENRILQGTVDNAFKVNFKFVKDSLDDLIRISNKNNFSLTLAVLPVAAQAMKDYPNELYQSSLKQYAEHNSLDFVDLLPTLRNCYEQYGASLVIPFDGHYNAKVHKAFGMTMAEHLSRLIMN